MSKTCRGKGAYNFKAKGIPVSKNRVRKLRLMSRYAEFSFSDWNTRKIGAPRIALTRASEDPLVMLEKIVAKAFEDKLDTTESPTNKILKSATESGEAKARCFIEGDGTKKVTDDFKTPFTDNVLFSERNLFSQIFIQDRDGRFTILSLFKCQVWTLSRNNTWGTIQNLVLS
jgi:hypothetical protein